MTKEPPRVRSRGQGARSETGLTGRGLETCSELAEFVAYTAIQPPSSADPSRRGQVVFGAHEQQPGPFSSDEDSPPLGFDDSEHTSLIRAIIDSQQLGAPAPSASAFVSPCSVDGGPHAFIMRAIIGPQNAGIANSAVHSAASFVRFCFCSLITLLLSFSAPCLKALSMV